PKCNRPPAPNGRRPEKPPSTSPHRTEPPHATPSLQLDRPSSGGQLAAGSTRGKRDRADTPLISAVAAHAPHTDPQPTQARPRAPAQRVHRRVEGLEPHERSR